MTYNEKKQFLESYITNQRKILSLQNELDEWMTVATNITQKITPVIVNTNETSSKIENCAIKIAEIQANILNELSVAEYNRTQVKKAITRVRDTRRREILEMRYVGNIPVRTIAIKLDKDTDNIYKMIRTGIKNLEIGEDNEV